MEKSQTDQPHLLRHETLTRSVYPEASDFLAVTTRPLVGRGRLLGWTFRTPCKIGSINSDRYGWITPDGALTQDPAFTRPEAARRLRVHARYPQRRDVP